MAKIVKLSDDLSNMIAAGEVVERISSVVKELVENAIDANSTYIDIHLKDSGFEEIKIIDNGIGMSSEDALLAFSRHATSKIKNKNDLFRITSLGFRGEAIPSIASVSHFHMITSEGDTGYEVLYQGGKLVKKGKTSSRKGTSITISKLFFNTPARLKYLKSPSVELSSTIEYLNKMALSNLDISFTLANNGRVLLKTSGKNDILEVLGNIYSLEVVKKVHRFQNKSFDFDIEGYLIAPEINRASRSYITILANGRVIKNNSIIRAVIDGYDTYLHKGRYPIVVLDIKLDPLLIDVNIHPSKLEVKFSEEKRLVSFITQTIHDKLKELHLIPEMKEVKKPIIEHEQTTFTFPKQYEEPTVVKEEQVLYKDPLINTTIYDEEVVISSSIEDKQDVFIKQEEKPIRRIPKMHYIGQYHKTYLLCENEEGFFIIDQHAAAERVRYERYLKKMGNPAKEYYELLIPINYELSNSEAIKVSNYLDDIKRFGIVLEPSGISSYYIRQVPSWFPKGYEESYTEVIVNAVITGKDIEIIDVRDSLAKLLSCKQSIKANKYLSEVEIYKLLDNLEHCENPYFCPHGRPTIIKYSLYDVEKLFKRVM